MGLFALSEMESLVRAQLNAPTEGILSSAEIRRALNDGYKDVSRLAGCIENYDVVSTVSGDRLVPYDAHKVNFVYYGDADYVGGGGGKGVVDPGPGGGIGSDGWTETTAYTYTGDGTFTMSSDGYVEILIVGAGGEGGQMSGDINWVSGAGGGGGVIYEASHWLAAGDYPVVVGLPNFGDGNSSFDGLIALKGGIGGGYLPGSNWPGGDGGSGGGGVSGNLQSSKEAVGPAGAGTPGQGNDGADGSGHVDNNPAWLGWGGGGGGASAPGIGKDGGEGYACDISGSLVVYGSGGAGADVVGQMSYSNGSPGTNGGAPKQNGVDGTGGGGGCALYEGAPTAHGMGGAGTFIIRYPYGGGGGEITWNSPTMTSATTPSPYVEIKSSQQSATYAAWKAFDKNPSSYWCSDNTGAPTQWVGLDCGDPAPYPVVTGCSIKNFLNNGFKDFKVQGSANGIDWNDVYTGYANNNTTVQSYSFSNANAYRYWRIYAVTAWGGVLLAAYEITFSGTR